MNAWPGADDPLRAGSPPARRLRVRAWRDPRMLAGVLLVVGSTVLGAKVLAGGDDTVDYWSVREPVTSGEQVERSDLVLASLRVSGASADTYLRADDDFPAALDALVWARDLEAGALLDRSTVVHEDAVERTELPLGVEPGSMPGDLSAGHRVDVWVAPTQGESASPAQLVLPDVRVVSTGEETASLSSVERTVLVDVGELALTGEVVGTISSGRVTLVRRA